MKKLILLLAALLTAMTTWASTFTVTNSGNKFTITRNTSVGTDLVFYRTVSLSAIAGEHFTEAVGSLFFDIGQTQQTVTVTEANIANVSAYYQFQTGTTRSYRFEVLDLGGFLLAYKDRNISYGTDYQLTTNYLNLSVNDLVYFDNNGNIKSGSGNKYLDVSYSSSNWIKVTDGGYNQAVHTVSTDAIFNGNDDLRSYFYSNFVYMCATVYFTQKEGKDGYQYIQILNDQESNYDINDPDGAVNDPHTSLYKACFELSYTGDVITDEHYQFFPHRYDYVNKAAETSAGLNRYEFDDNNTYLYQQKFRDDYYNAPNTGSLKLSPSFKNLNIRFDAAGRSDDDWYFKDLKVRLALVDDQVPILLNNIKVSGARHCKGNTIYVSVPFCEIVTVSGTTTLNTSWGTLNYVSGSGTNVLTFSGPISLNASGNFILDRLNGTITDLLGNPFSQKSIDRDLGIGLDASIEYSITYDLTGGHLLDGEDNPTSYYYESYSFTLNNPVRDGYLFTGWTGSNGNTPELTVTINRGSGGDRTYIANWTSAPKYTFNSSTGALTLNWGEYNKNNKWGNDVNAFAVKSVYAHRGVKFTGDCSELFENFCDCEDINLENVITTSMVNASSMFSGCMSLTSLSIGSWHTRGIQYMDNMFSRCSSLNSLGSITGWDTWNALSMSNMFSGCSNLKGLNLENWHIDHVKNLSNMFSGCSSLDSLNLSNWTIDNATNLSGMFYNCSRLNSLKISRWTTSNVTRMDSLFSGCSRLTRLDIGDWSCDNVTSMSKMFDGCLRLTSLDISRWTTNNVTDMSYMFNGCESLNSFDVSNLNTGNVTRMDYMFSGCWNLNSLDVSNLNTGNVTRMDHMFSGCWNLNSLNVSNINTGNVTRMDYMFSNCENLSSLDVSNFNTGKVTNMSNMFNQCWRIESFDVANWNTSNVTDMSGMFADCQLLKSLDVSNWNTDKVTNMSGMFRPCRFITSLDISGWSTSNVTDMSGMFEECNELTLLDLSNWNTGKVTDMSNMFRDCVGMLTIYAGTGWSTDSVTASDDMFYNCVHLLGGMGTNLDWNYLDKTYARIDGGPSNPGYFTAKALRGDVNGDNDVSIADVTALIDYLLSGNASGINTVSADCNLDTDISIADVTALIDYLLSSAW